MAKKRATRSKNWYTELSPPAKVGFWAIVGGGGFLIGRWVYNRVQHAEIHKRLKQRTEYQVAPGVNLQSVAHNIYDAFYNADITGTIPDWLKPGEGSWTEDEEAAIRELRKVPPEYIQDLAFVYAQEYNKDLYVDFRKYLNNTDYKRVENLLELGVNDCAMSDNQLTPDGRVIRSLGAVLGIGGLVTGDSSQAMIGGAMYLFGSQKKEPQTPPVFIPDPTSASPNINLIPGGGGIPTRQFSPRPVFSSRLQQILQGRFQQ